MQQLYRDFVVALDSLVHPDWLGVASETNLVRAIAPAALYDGLVGAANQAAAAVRAADATAKLFVTIQVEVAWGRPAGTYTGIARDRADFAFAEAWGLSSFPYLGGWAAPESLPPDYYTRVVASDARPVMAIEGGWPSETTAGIPSTPATQRRYIARQAQLLDAAHAIGWFQITYTDLDVAAWSPGIEPFSRLGLVTTNLAPKPSLALWDSVFAIPHP